jgi:hypothetical protein
MRPTEDAGRRRFAADVKQAGVLLGALSRRQLLIRGGRLVVASAGGLWSLDRLAGAARAGEGLRKCISLGGPGSLRQDGHPDDYRLWGNREFIRDASETRWIKLWVSWHDLQQELGFPPPSRGDSWRHLNGAPGGQGWLRRLDGQVRAANEDRLGVILTLYHANPTWASGATGPDPVDPSKPVEHKLPLDVSPDGPWAWFVAYLIARYRKGSRPNPFGPEGALAEIAVGYDPLFGNPDGAAIDALEICNEPNQLAWPQEGVVEATAQMIRSATLLSAALGRDADPGARDFRLSGLDRTKPARCESHGVERLHAWRPRRARRVSRNRAAPLVAPQLPRRATRNLAGSGRAGDAARRPLEK